jgi:hypothetical protein
MESFFDEVNGAADAHTLHPTTVDVAADYCDIHQLSLDK